MLNINSSGKFKKDLKMCLKRGYNLEQLQNVIDILRIPDKLPEKNKDHYELYLDRTGTHSDLFKK